MLKKIIAFAIATAMGAAATTTPSFAYSFSHVGCRVKICTSYAPGAPGTFAGPCTSYKYVYYLTCPRTELH
jgi:hypothetical protein